MRFGGLQRFTLIDYPGKIAATVFTVGCNFRCPYCHNPELVLPDKFSETIAEDEIISFLETRKGKIEGLAITGGEPTIFNELPAFIKKVKLLGFVVKLDTNGTNPKMLKELIDNRLIDFVAMDIKAQFSRYNELAGVKVDLAKIKESINLIKNSGLEHEFRTTVPSPILQREDIRVIIDELDDEKNYIVKPANDDTEMVGGFLKLDAISQEELDGCLADLKMNRLTISEG